MMLVNSQFITLVEKNTNLYVVKYLLIEQNSAHTV